MIAFTCFDAAFQTAYADLAERALTQSRLLLCSPGTIITQEKNGGSYLYWRVYDAEGQRRDHYIGSRDHVETAGKLAEITACIVEGRSFAEGSLMLRKQGYAAADNSAAITLATLFNAGVFKQGAMLVGTHAFGALINSLGVRLSTHYFTEDIDIARYDRIELAIRLEEGFIGLLKQSGLPFIEVPALDVRKPSTSFRVRGRKLTVDLLAPGDERYRSVPIAELGAYATGLPYLDYLFEEPVFTVVLGRDHVIPVRTPNAARFCLHKLIVATLRLTQMPQKAEKDLTQAAVLAAVLSEQFPGALDEAVQHIPPTALRRVAQSAVRAQALLPERYAAAHDFLTELAALQCR